MAALEQQWYLYSSVYIKLLLPHKKKKKPETAAGFELGVNEKVPGVKLPARLQANPSVETNISFVRHMFLRQVPSKSCSINFTVCFTDLPFPPCVIFLIESRF